MTTPSVTTPSMTTPSTTALSPWPHVGRAAASLAAGMSVGRFVYTPILPLMRARAGLSAGAGAHLATADRVGYLTGALAGIALPALVRSRSVLRGSLLLLPLPLLLLLLLLLPLTATFAAMPATHSTTVWAALRLLAGSASALVSAVLFGATFLGVSTLALAAGAALRYPRSVALLTAGYSVGRILGPLLVAPLLHDGYRPALLLAALVVVTATSAAAC
ncbi:YbfB/YjiJ family MFS transporter [Streptomyces chartreusis]|uniref:YbfB/YjiJ family MFS transporter n=1 Tax=Streptomyces chartreusis TaxID=1969 RepID=UPI003634A99B